MRKNKVQFQRGMSLSEIMHRYGMLERCGPAMFPGAGRRASLARSAVMRGTARSSAGVCFSATPALDRPR